MAEKNKNNKDSQKGQVTPKKYLKKEKKLCRQSIFKDFKDSGQRRTSI